MTNESGSSQEPSTLAPKNTTSRRLPLFWRQGAARAVMRRNCATYDPSYSLRHAVDIPVRLSSHRCSHPSHRRSAHELQPCRLLSSWPSPPWHQVLTTLGDTNHGTPLRVRRHVLYPSHRHVRRQTPTRAPSGTKQQEILDMTGDPTKVTTTTSPDRCPQAAAP